jgi:hypothetical protein
MERKMTTEEERFRKAVPFSMKAVNAFADYLRRKGYETQINQVTVRPRFEDRDQYGDKEDLKARRGDNPWKRFEIKGLGVAFTSKDDWPFRSVFVDRATKTSERADWYISLSRDLCYSAIVDGVTHERWIVQQVNDTKKGYAYQVYSCPIELARFVRIA